jgi:hypothetical protein
LTVSVTHLKKLMLEELERRKFTLPIRSLTSCQRLVDEYALIDESKKRPPIFNKTQGGSGSEDGSPKTAKAAALNSVVVNI